VECDDIGNCRINHGVTDSIDALYDIRYDFIEFDLENLVVVVLRHFISQLHARDVVVDRMIKEMGALIRAAMYYAKNAKERHDAEIIDEERLTAMLKPAVDELDAVSLKAAQWCEKAEAPASSRV
jgi:hypothetical protein